MQIFPNYAFYKNHKIFTKINNKKYIKANDFFIYDNKNYPNYAKLSKLCKIIQIMQNYSILWFHPNYASKLCKFIQIMHFIKIKNIYHNI